MPPVTHVGPALVALGGLPGTGKTEHRRRVTGRVSDIPGLRLPTWADVVGRDYEPWAPDLSLATTSLTLDEVVARMADAVAVSGIVAR